MTDPDEKPFDPESPILVRAGDWEALEQQLAHWKEQARLAHCDWEIATRAFAESDAENCKLADEIDRLKQELRQHKEQLT